MFAALQAWDNALFLFVNHWAVHPFMDPIAKFFSGSILWCGGVILLLGLGAMKRSRRLLLLSVLLSLSIAVTDSFCARGVKPFVQRFRPCVTLRAETRAIEGCGGIYGFPSNHSANAMAVVCSLWVAGETLWAVGLLPLALCGLSRIYLGVHYPSDVLAGLVIGGILGWTLARLFFGLPSWLRDSH